MSAFLSTKKERREKIIATITKEGLIYLSPLYVSMKNFNHVKQFIQDYKPLGFYDKESERIYYKKRNEEESTK